MLHHLARLSVITIALALVAGLGFLLARPAAPTVITVVVPPAQVAATTAPTTIVQPVPYLWGRYNCHGTRVCYWH